MHTESREPAAIGRLAHVRTLSAREARSWPRCELAAMSDNGVAVAVAVADDSANDTLRLFKLLFIEK